MKAVLFDWDNTLVDTWPILYSASQSLFDSFGLPRRSLHEVQIAAKQSTRESFPLLFGKNWQQAQTFFQDKVRELSKTHLKLFAGVETTLAMLKKNGTRLGVISNKNKKMLHEEIKSCKILPFFEVILGSTDALHDKPAADLGHIALQTLNLSSDHVLYVGDSISDYQFSRNVSLKFVLFGENPDIKESNEDISYLFHAHNHEQLAGFFEKKLLESL